MTGSTRRWELGLLNLVRHGLLSRWMAVLIVGIVGGLGVAAVIIPSPSPSLPPGYYIRALPLHPLRVGDLVVLEVPEALKPSLPAWYTGRRLLKQVAGLAGTHVCWEGTRMVVQGPGQERHYLFAPHPPTDPRMHGCQVLGADEMLIAGQHERSVDSRYTGVVSTSLVRFRVWPLWTWE